MALCKAVKAAGVSCLPVRQTSGTWQLVKTDMTLQAARDARPGPKSEVRGRAHAAKPVTKPVAITASPSSVNAALTGPAAGSTGPLFRIQLAAYRDFSRALLGKEILTTAFQANFRAWKFSKKTAIQRTASP